MTWEAALEEYSLQMLPAAYKLALLALALPWLSTAVLAVPWLSWTASPGTDPSEGSETRGPGQLLTLPSVVK